MLKIFKMIFALLFLHTLYAEPVILMFMIPYPYSCDELMKKAKKLSQPGKLPRHNLKTICKKTQVAGILSTYAGFFGVSNEYGQTTFPLKQHQQQLQIIVTPKAIPIIMHGVTVHHWEVDAESPCAVYSLERVKDEASDLTVWTVKYDFLNQNCDIPLESILIFAHPEQVYIPQGATITNESPNFILPDIYIKTGKDLAKIATQWLSLAHFYGPLNPMMSTQPLSRSFIIGT